MAKFVTLKLLRLIGVVFAVSALTFVMVAMLPADIAYDIAGQDATPAQIEAIRAELGLDQNVLVRYGHWLMSLAQGDMGRSFRSDEPVLDAIWSRLPVTIELLVLSQVFALLLAIPAGVYCAYRAGSRFDRVLGSTGFGMISVPTFVLAIVLIYLFALRLEWLPATGYEPFSEGVWANLRTFVLPSLSIALVEWVPLMRTLRSDMIATLKEDFISMAKAKGLPAWRILTRHALRPSSFTLITILGLQIGGLIGGALIIETIFALPGIGRLLINAIYARDYMIVQGCILFIAVGYVVINFVVDMLYVALDPRIRTAGAGG
ncbi:MAG: ABC transporter permease [Alphaproteobacteria bacterium]|jgi:peptide/nickel transport system permease protein|nr:ABC transporter permease [Alphaproteobacteria bacterium]